MHQCFVISLAAYVLLVSQTSAHSFMTEPQPISPMECRIGGQPSYGIENCPGPCDTTFLKFNGANYGSPENPAATYTRGQSVTIKYTRNNHAPGGFVRTSLVKPGDMMDKEAHSRGAFHYSCWGAHVEVATEAEKKKDGKGYSIADVDGKNHNKGPAYYTTNITIPDVVPDGDYVFGWAWFGGTGGTIDGDTGPADLRNDDSTRPANLGFFGDVSTTLSLRYHLLSSFQYRRVAFNCQH
jgi:hypothetical protein